VIEDRWKSIPIMNLKWGFVLLPSIRVVSDTYGFKLIGKDGHVITDEELFIPGISKQFIREAIRQFFCRYPNRKTKEGKPVLLTIRRKGGADGGPLVALIDEELFSTAAAAAGLLPVQLLLNIAPGLNSVFGYYFVDDGLRFGLDSSSGATGIVHPAKLKDDALKSANVTDFVPSGHWERVYVGMGGRWETELVFTTDVNGQISIEVKTVWKSEPIYATVYVVDGFESQPGLLDFGKQFTGLGDRVAYESSNGLDYIMAWTDYVDEKSAAQSAYVKGLLDDMVGDIMLNLRVYFADQAEAEIKAWAEDNMLFPKTTGEAEGYKTIAIVDRDGNILPSNYSESSTEFGVPALGSYYYSFTQVEDFLQKSGLTDVSLEVLEVGTISGYHSYGMDGYWAYVTVAFDDLPDNISDGFIEELIADFDDLNR
jgi:hypothetical protein